MIPQRHNKEGGGAGWGGGDMSTVYGKEGLGHLRTEINIGGGKVKGRRRLSYLDNHQEMEVRQDDRHKLYAC